VTNSAHGIRAEHTLRYESRFSKPMGSHPLGSLLPNHGSEVEENPSNVIREMTNDKCIPYIDSMCAIKPWTRNKFSNS